MSEGDASTTARWCASIVLYHSRQEVVLLTLDGVARQRLPVDVIQLHVNEDPLGEVAASIREAIHSRWPDTTVVVSSSTNNLGFAAAHNALMLSAFACGADAVLVLNPDVILEPQTVLELARASDGQALAGPLLVLADPVTLESEGRIDSAGIRWTWAGRHFDSRQGEKVTLNDGALPYSVAGITGACLWVPHEVHDQIVDATGELFDEHFIAYREDAELGLRASRLGVRQIVVPSATARHGRAARGTERGRPNIDRLSVQNRFLIAFKHGRHRPGAWFGAPLRDIVVVATVLCHERESREGLRSAWRLRPTMRAKGRRIRAAERARDRSNNRPIA